jgi:GT2 family glycosyltransferase
VVVPYFNAAATLRDALTSILGSDYDRLQVIAVDDGSTDGTYATVADLPCHHVALERQSGAAVARNVGAHAAEGEVLFFLDADVIVRPDTIRRAAQALAEEELAAVFGEYTAETVPTNFASVYKNLIHHYTHQTSRPDAASFWCGCGAIRTKVFRRVGGFDESYAAASVEDIELGYRLHAAGHRIRLDKAVRVTHLKRYTIVSLVRSDVKYRAIPWTKLMARRNFFRPDLNLRFRNILSAFLLVVFLWWVAWALPGADRRELAWIVGGTLAAYVFLNAGILAFVARRKGPFFLCLFALMYAVTYLYSVVGFALGIALHLRDRFEGKDRV